MAPQVLSRLGADLDEVERQLLQVLPGQYSDASQTLRSRVLAPSPGQEDPIPAELAARLDSIQETLRTIADRLAGIEQRLTQ